VYERVREQFSEDELVHLATTWPAASRRCTRRADRRALLTDGDEHFVTSGFELRVIEREHSRLKPRT
jgi:hypothetical protein